jgi:hypothetical protein
LGWQMLETLLPVANIDVKTVAIMMRKLAVVIEDMLAQSIPET